MLPTFPLFPPQLISGRAMRKEIPKSLQILVLPEAGFAEIVTTFTQSSDELVEWLVGNPIALLKAFQSKSSNNPLQPAS